MKKIFRTFSITLLTSSFLSALPAQAMFWQSAEVMTPRTYEVGGIAGLSFDPSKFMGYGQFKAGLAPRFELEARMGAGGYDFYLGGFGKYALFSRNGLSFSLMSGIYNQGNAYVEVAPIGTIDIGRMDLYFGPDFALSLGDRSSGSTFNIGVSIPYERRFSIFGELDIKLSNLPSSVLAGMRARF